jgi:hypothetical protein
VVLALLTVTLGFLLASSPARNSDLWLHLASGRALAQGQSPVGGDPFLHTSQGAHWVNPNWLYDLLLYASFRLLGGTGLVVLKACLGALLAALLILLGRSGRDLSLPSVCAALSALALGPWLTVQPVLASCLLLALTLLLVERGVRELAEARRPWNWWVLPAVFALWANLDGWFVLGPAVLALGALGLALTGRTREARSLALVLVLGTAATLLTPNHVRAWTLPEGLFSFDQQTGAVGLPGLAASPLAPAYYRSALGASPAGLAYPALVVLVLVALALNRGGRAWRWAPLGLGLLLLSAWNAAAVPFFAVVAGPLCALNFAEAYLRRPQAAAGAPSERWQGAALAGSILAGVVLVVCAWPGWLQGEPYGRRAWSVEVDESLRAAAEQLARWQREGALGAQAHGFNYSPEIAHYCAWFGPEARGFFDSRLRLDPRTAADFAVVRRGIRGPRSAAEAEAQENPDAWRAVLRSRGVNHLVLHNSDAEPTSPLVYRLASMPEEWDLIYLKGRTAVFGWRDPQDGGRSSFGRLRLDLTERAYSPEDRAPANGPGRGPRRPHWWTPFLAVAPLQPPDQDEAAHYLAYFDAQRPRYQNRLRLVWQGVVIGGLVGSAAAGREPLPAALDMAVRLGGSRTGWTAFAARRDDGPSAVLLLAIRAARRALAANPDDAKSYFALGEAYFRLSHDTRERSWRWQFPKLDRIRQAQMLTAYRQVLLLRPDLPQAHGRLARLYRERNHLDLTLEHLSGLLASTQARGPKGGQSPEQFQQDLAGLREEQQALAKEVEDRLKQWEVSTANQRVIDRARQAVQMGLPARALKLMLKSDLSVFGPQGMSIELDLLLWAGRAKEAREWLTPEHQSVLGSMLYHEVRARLGAAVGDYAEAERDMQANIALLERRADKRGPARLQAAQYVTNALGQVPMLEGTPPVVLKMEFVRYLSLTEANRLFAGLREAADVDVLRGLLLLESGQTEQAAAAFRRALAVWKSAAAARSGAGLNFSGRRIAQDYLRALGG